MHAAKFASGTLVKLPLGDSGDVYYNYVLDSYYNADIGDMMYRLDENVAMPIYPESGLADVSSSEFKEICSTGLLRHGPRGGWIHPAPGASH